MLVARGTKKILDRADDPFRTTLRPPGCSATGTRTRCSGARSRLSVNARTLLPVLVPLAPAATVTARLPAAFAKIARRLDVEALTLEGELAAMAEQVLAKTSSRSVLGVMNEFARMADSYRWTEDHIDLAELSLWLAQRGSRIATEGPIGARPRSIPSSRPRSVGCARTTHARAITAA